MDGRLSILGLYRYDQTLFDDMALPDNNFSLDYEDLYIEPLPIDKDTLVFSLITELSQFSVIYPDSDLMKMAIKAWSIKKRWTWQKAYESFFFKYNPIWNKDGKITDTETRDLETTGTGGNVKTLNTTTTDTGSTNGQETAQNTNVRSVNAFNGGLTEAERITDNGTITTQQSSNGTSKDTGTITDQSNTSSTDSGTVTHDIFERGNIGVTMTQQMITADRELYRNNIYDIIIRDFKNEFCILVY